MQYITIFHANLNYAYLTEDRYEFVIRRTYEMTLDTMQAEFPDVPFVFEASGYTLEHMAQKTPDVLGKIKGGDRARSVRVHGLTLCPSHAAELSEG